jgi:hypothetical protein
MMCILVKTAKVELVAQMGRGLDIVRTDDGPVSGVSSTSFSRAGAHCLNSGGHRRPSSPAPSSNPLGGGSAAACPKRAESQNLGP